MQRPIEALPLQRTSNLIGQCKKYYVAQNVCKKQHRENTNLEANCSFKKIFEKIGRKKDVWEAQAVESLFHSSYDLVVVGPSPALRSALSLESVSDSFFLSPSTSLK